MKRQCRNLCNVCLLLAGVALITLGVGIFVYFEALFNYFMVRAMEFSPQSESFWFWRDNNPPLELDIYLFNWTNPKDLEKKGVKPRFEEIGPYRFKERKEKVNLTWNDHNHTISYRTRKFYYFDPVNSKRQLSDMITMINVVPLSIAYQSRNYGYFAKRSVSYSLSSFSTLYVTKTARELLFDGYEDAILGFLSSMPLSGIQDKFGLLYGKNNTISKEIYSMYTKVDEDFGKIMSWNYGNESRYYEGECNAVRGSVGEFYPFNRKRDHIELFSSELCKSAKFLYDKDVVVKGVQGYKYTGRHVFDNGSMFPENQCFCGGQCQPSGVFNVSMCRQHSPTFLSLPHFYNADPYYINAIEGMKPEDKYELYITLEPKTGIVIDIAPKMQVNMLVQPIEYITMYKNVPKVFMPIFYFDQSLPASDDLASLLIHIQSLPEVSNIAIVVLESLGIGCIAWVALSMYFSSRRLQKTKKNQVDCKITATVEEIPLRC